MLHFIQKQTLHFILLLMLFVGGRDGFGQKEANNWYFGEKAAINFSNGSPVAVLNSQMNSHGGSASMSDSAGNLLFYTDGIQVWNRNHQVMANGTGLGTSVGYMGSSHPVIIVPKPGNTGVYYIFTVDGPASGYIRKGLRYSVLDMGLNSGMGDITSVKNIPLTGGQNACGRLTAVSHGNSNDVWIITRLYDDDKYASYLLKANGIVSTPVISQATKYMTIYGLGDGILKITPDGTQLFNIEWYGIERCGFNIFTGKVSPYYYFSVPDNGGIYDALEFSPDSRFLYTSSNSNYKFYVNSTLLK
jgi:hypothetical protein